MAGQQKRTGSNLTDEELEDIKKAVRADATVWGHFLKYCVVGFPEWGAEYYAYEALATQVRPDANDFAIATAGVDLRVEAARAQGMDLKEAQIELRRIENEEMRAGRKLPDEQDKDARLELFNRAGGKERSSKASQ
jgi:hypothetical protein